MDNGKRTFVDKVQSMANSLAMHDHILADLSAIYNSRQYGPGGAKAFTDEELQALETLGGRAMSADDIYSFIILCDQLRAFFHNGTPVQNDYAATVNHIRTDI
jgi:hypothetical protein